MKSQIIEQKYLVQIYMRRGLTFIKGEGVYLIDSKGDKYLDLMGNIAVNILGYSHQGIVNTICSQAKTLTNLHGSFANDKRAQATKALIQKMPESLTRVFFSNSGTEAVEAALKFAHLKTGCCHFVVSKGAYHGKTLGALSLMGNAKYREPFNKLINPNVSFVEFNDIKDLESQVDEKTAAVILEPIQGEAGIISATYEFLKSAREITEEKGSLLIFDEIQSGMGRTGKLLSSSWSEVQSDIVCLAKGLSAGFPIGATVVSESVHQKIPRGSHTSTFGGNPLSCAVCLKTLELLTEDLLYKVEKLGNYFIDGLRQIKSEKIVEIRGKGLMIGIELSISNTKVLKALQQRKILAAPSGSNVIRLLPPYIIEKEHINLFIKEFEEILKEV